MATEATTNLITITVKPANSHLPGSLGWVQEKLQTVQLQVRQANGVNGRILPALYYGYGTGSQCSALLAQLGYAPGGDGRRSFAIHYAPTALVADRVYTLFSQESREEYGMFDYLTAPARDLVEAFIVSAVAAFRAALDHDDKVQLLTFDVKFTAAE